MTDENGNAKVRKQIAEGLIKEMFGDWGMKNMSTKIEKDGVSIASLLNEIFRLREQQLAEEEKEEKEEEQEKEDEEKDDPAEDALNKFFENSSPAFKKLVNTFCYCSTIDGTDDDDDDEEEEDSTEEHKSEKKDWKIEHVSSDHLMNDIRNLIAKAEKDRDPFCKTKIERNMPCTKECDDCPMIADAKEIYGDEEVDDEHCVKLPDPIDTVTCLGVFPFQAYVYPDGTYVVSSLRGPRMTYQMGECDFYKNFLVLNSVEDENVHKAPKEYFKIPDEAVKRVNMGKEHIHYVNDNTALVEIEASTQTKAQFAVNKEDDESFTKPELITGARANFAADLYDHIKFVRDWALNGVEK